MNQISDMSSATARLSCLMATTLLMNRLVISNVSLKEYGTINCCLAMSSFFSCLKLLDSAVL